MAPDTGTLSTGSVSLQAALLFEHGDVGFDDVHGREANQQADSDDGHHQVVQLSENRDEVRNDVHRHRQVQHEQGWNEPDRPRDALIERQPGDQAKLVSPCQPPHARRELLGPRRRLPDEDEARDRQEDQRHEYGNQGDLPPLHGSSLPEADLLVGKEDTG